MLPLKLTEEQKSCVEYPLTGEVLVINAGPGTGKTEILKERTKFIIQQNKKQKIFILILAFNKDISLAIRRKLNLLIEKEFFLLEKRGHFRQSKLDSRLSVWIINRTIHSLTYWIFSEEIERSGKRFKFIDGKRRRKHSFWFWTTSTTNLVEITNEAEDYLKKIPLRYRLMGAIWLNLDRYVLRKISSELKEKLKACFREKIEVKSEESPIIHQRVIYQEYLPEVWTILESENQLDIYEKIKNFFLENQSQIFWLTFDDLIANVYKLLRENVSVRRKWQIFDYILVDECQDLDEKKLKIIKLICHSKTNLTFVGDPKQSIYGFMGVKDSFKLIRESFAKVVQKNITESFRSPQEILEVVNNFSHQFLSEWHHIDLKSRLKSGKKVLIFGGENWESQMQFLREKIDSIKGEKSVKAILFRNKNIGEKIKKWLKKYNRETIFLDEEEGDNLEEIIKKLKQVKEEELTQYNSLENFLEETFSQKITNEYFQELVADFDNNLKSEQELWVKKFPLTTAIIKRFVWELEEGNFSQLPISNFAGKIILSTIHKTKGLEFDYVFLVEINEGVLPSKKVNDELEKIEERRVFYVGITRAKKELYLCSSNQGEISSFIRNLDLRLLEILPSDLELLPDKKEEIIISVPLEVGTRGEKKVYELLSNSSISFQKLTSNWEKIPNLEIDILAITENHIYIIEVKNWNREYFKLHKKEILEQQEYREEIIPNHFFNEKKSVDYIICFPNQEIGIKFKEFLTDIGKPGILVAHYEEEMGELANIFPTNDIERIDKLIEEIEKEFKI